MSDKILDTMSGFSAAEDFFHYLEVSFEPSVVHVNRLHILKRFNQYLARDGVAGCDDASLKASYKELLERAYQDFVKSDAATEKVFKVFQEQDGQHVVGVDSLRASLSGRRGA
jgi:nitrogenase-stabilizing/protective protein